MKLSHARLCVECEEVFTPIKTYTTYGIGMARCPSCGNSATLSIAQIFENIDRNIKRLEEALNEKETQHD